MDEEHDVFLVDDDDEQLLIVDNLYQNLLRLLDLMLIVVAAFLALVTLTVFGVTFWHHRSVQSKSFDADWPLNFHIEFCNSFCSKSGLKTGQELAGIPLDCQKDGQRSLDRPWMTPSSRNSSRIVTNLDRYKMCGDVTVETQPDTFPILDLSQILGQFDEESLILSAQSCFTQTPFDDDCMDPPTLCDFGVNFQVQRSLRSCYNVSVKIHGQNYGKCRQDRYVLNTESYDQEEESFPTLRLYNDGQVMEELNLAAGFETNLIFGSSINIQPLTSLSMFNLLTPTLDTLKSACDSYKKSSLDRKYPQLCNSLSKELQPPYANLHPFYEMLSEFIKQNLAIVKLTKCF